MNGALFATCVIPACSDLVEHVGDVCPSCLSAFGDMLQPTDRPAMTESEIAERDGWVRDVLAQRRELLDLVSDAERKANQLCWMCEQRRVCLKMPAGWECETCRDIS